MYNETRIKNSAQLQSDLALQAEALRNKLERNKVKKKSRLQNEEESHRELLFKITREINLLKKHLNTVETKLDSMQKTKPTPRNSLNTLDLFDFDVDKLLNTLTALFDLYKENGDKELLNKILDKTTILNNKINMRSLPQMGQPFGNLLQKLNKIDFEKILNTLSLVSHLYKETTNENEDDVMNKEI